MIDEPLYLKGLLIITSPRLIDRYNKALEQLGFVPTQLDCFHVDRLGWSPEIAQERASDAYLMHGEANPLAIIVSPEQMNCACYAPVSSLMMDIMDHVYTVYDSAIADICRDAALWFDFDQGLSGLTHPWDVMLIAQVSVQLSAGELTRAAKAQATMVRHFLEDPMAWFHPRFRQHLIDSSREHGDLRQRRLVIPDLHYYEVDNFFTPVYGGLIRLKGQTSGREYLVFCDQQNFSRYGSSSRKMLDIHDESLLELLLEEQLIVVELEAFQGNVKALETIMAHLQVAYLGAFFPEIDLTTLTHPQRKGLLRQVKDKLPDVLYELEMVMLKLASGQSVRNISLSLKLLLAQPHPTCSEQQRKTLQRLLNRLRPHDSQALYALDRAQFFRDFASLPAARQNWLRQEIAPADMAQDFEPLAISERLK